MITSRYVVLSRNEVNYLESASFLSPTLLECLQCNTQWQSDVEVKLGLTSTMAEEFRNAFTEQLAKVGFDEEYELTEEGRLLEDLIDRFYYP